MDDRDVDKRQIIVDCQLILKPFLNQAEKRNLPSKLSTPIVEKIGVCCDTKLFIPGDASQQAILCESKGPFFLLMMLLYTDI